MRKLGIVLGALLMVVGFAAEIGAYGERRFPPRKPLPLKVLARGGIPPALYYGPPLSRHRYRYPYRAAIYPAPYRRALPGRGFYRARRPGRLRHGTVDRVYTLDIVARGRAYASQRRR